jgi:hypothetical protein
MRLPATPSHKSLSRSIVLRCVACCAWCCQALGFVAASGQPTGAIATGDSCGTAIEISAFFGQNLGETLSTGLFDNSGATASAGDPLPGCFSDAQMHNSLWFSFLGNGGRYRIETAPCAAAAHYVEGGDTQMAVFMGENCSGLSPVDCNEDVFVDLDPLTDYRAGLELQTLAGQRYFLLVDGYQAASGQFCLQIRRLPSTDCSGIAVGDFSLDNGGYLCRGQNLQALLHIEESGFQIPTAVPLSGVLWLLSDQPLPTDSWPGGLPGIQSSTLSPALGGVSLLNNSNNPTPLALYLTPVVVGGATLLNPLLSPTVANLDPAQGCYMVGSSKPLTIVPQLQPLEALPTVLPTTPGQNGSILLAVSGGYPQALGSGQGYQFLWSSGTSTQHLTDMSAGTYTVTISDPSGCVAPLAISATLTAPTTAPDLLRHLEWGPNPSRGPLWLRLTLPEPMPLQIELIDPTGRVLQRQQYPNAQQLDWETQLPNPGLYCVRLQLPGIQYPFWVVRY